MRTCAALLLAAAFATPIRSDDAKDNDLQGTWNVLEFTVGGKSVENAENERTVVIRGDRFDFYYGDKKDPSEQYHLVLDATVMPKAIDFHKLDANGKRGDKRAEGIFEFDGGKLRICFKPQAGPPWCRPTTMQSKEESGEALLVFRRKARAD